MLFLSEFFFRNLTSSPCRMFCVILTNLCITLKIHIKKFFIWTIINKFTTINFFKKVVTSVGKDMEKLKPLHNYGKQLQLLWKTFGDPQWNNTELNMSSLIPSLSIYWWYEKYVSTKHLYINISMLSSIIAKKLETLIHLLTDEMDKQNVVSYHIN